MQIALNTTARQLSECLYIYYETGTDDFFKGEGGTSSEVMEKVSEYMNSIMEAFGIENDYLSGLSEAIGNTSIADIIDSQIWQLVFKKVMETELKLSADTTAEDFYRRMHVSDPKIVGKIDKNGKLVMGSYYEVQVIKLLNIDFSFKFFNVVRSNIWKGND